MDLPADDTEAARAILADAEDHLAALKATMQAELAQWRAANDDMRKALATSPATGF